MTESPDYSAQPGDEVEYTGRYLVLLDQDAQSAGVSALYDAAGVRTEDSREPAAIAGILDSGGSVVLDQIGVAVVNIDPDQQRALAGAAAAAEVLVIEPERVVTVLQWSADYLRGYRDGVEDLMRKVMGDVGGAEAAVAAATWDESRFTWGLQAVRYPETCESGRGVRVAVLDTGVDLTHRDLVGRSVTTASFIAGEEVQDGHGHGTHCIGTACGTRTPSTSPRYGIAGSADIYAGKVLSNAGRGADGGILAGINWAVAAGCRVVSMSLGAPAGVGSAYSKVYEQAAQRALAKGTVIVAAAGNESNRPASVQPVGHPANCPSILAVAALTADQGMARFSNAGINPDGGQVDIAGPGVDVLSSWPEPLGYRRISGTSMATPHVAGVLALLAGANPGATAAELKSLLLGSARRLPLASADVGAGIVQVG